MVEIVRFGKSTIVVREDIANSIIAVCLRCKGFGMLMHIDYMSPKGLTPVRADYVIWEGHEVPCSTCAGKGLYRNTTGK